MNKPALPFPRTYWVIPGRFLAGFYPGDLDPSRQKAKLLLASLWCLLNTQSFSACVLKAVNLGGDTDTTGCVAGGLAGVYYGIETIPNDWVAALPRQEELRALFPDFLRSLGHTGA